MTCGAPYPHPVRTHKPDSTLTGSGDHLLFEVSPLFPYFGETGRYDDCSPDTLLRAFAQDIRNSCRRCGDNGEIDITGNIGQPGIGGKPQYSFLVGINGIYVTVITGCEWSLHHKGSPLPKGVGCPDNGDGAWFEYAIEFVYPILFHARPLSLQNNRS